MDKNDQWKNNLIIVYFSSIDLLLVTIVLTSVRTGNFTCVLCDLKGTYPQYFSPSVMWATTLSECVIDIVTRRIAF